VTLAWRKLLSNPPAEWQRMPMVTRGIGNEVLRLLDSDGEIECSGEEPWAVVCRITGAHPNERRRVRDALDELVREGFLDVIEGSRGRVIVGRLPDLAARRKVRPASAGDASSVHPVGVQSASTEHPPSIQSASGASDFVDNPAQPLNSASVEKRREEEKREEEKRGEAPAFGQAPSAAAIRAAAEAAEEATIAALTSRYPNAPLVLAVRDQCRRTRKTGRMAASVWRGVLEECAGWPVDIVERAMETFRDKHDDGEKAEAYLVGIAKGEATRRAKALAVVRPIATAADHAKDATSEAELRALGLIGSTDEGALASQLSDYAKGALAHGR
jgi:hypothetical protein